MTKLISSAFLALALLGSTAGLFTEAHADNAAPRASVRCFLGAHGNASSGGGWTCVPEQRSAQS